MTRAFVYILRCQDSSLYTGYTTNLGRRLRVHNRGQGAKYTRGRLPVSLVYYEVLSSKPLAQRREYAIKQLSRDKKLDLINKLKLSLLSDNTDSSK